MDWIIKIEGKSNQRIRVNFDPISVILNIFGEYKPHNKEWIVFNKVDCNTIIAEEILKTIENVYVKMNENLEVYDKIVEILKPMKENGIKFNED